MCLLCALLPCAVVVELRKSGWFGKDVLGSVVFNLRDLIKKGHIRSAHRQVPAWGSCARKSSLVWGGRGATQLMCCCAGSVPCLCMGCQL